MISTLRFERRLSIPFRAKKDVFREIGCDLKRHLFPERRLFLERCPIKLPFVNFEKHARQACARSKWKENGRILFSGWIFFNGLLLRSLVFVLAKPSVSEKDVLFNLPLFNQIVFIKKVFKLMINRSSPQWLYIPQLPPSSSLAKCQRYLVSKYQC